MDDQDEFDISALDDGPSASGKKGKSSASSKNPKRDQKNARFGFGGKKRHVKSNTAESTAEFDFDHGKNKKPHKGFAGSGRTKKFDSKKALGKDKFSAGGRGGASGKGCKFTAKPRPGKDARKRQR